MGTRSLTIVKSRWDTEDEYGPPHVCAYRHYDGYPEEHGVWLGKLLIGLEVMNGRPSEGIRAVHGPAGLAAHLVVELHKDGHDPSLVEAGKDYDAEWVYHIFVDRIERGGYDVTLSVHQNGVLRFGSSVADFLGWLPKPTPAVSACCLDEVSMSPRKFHKTTLKLEVLSERPIPDHMPRNYVVEEIQDGSMVGQWHTEKAEELNAAQTAAALEEFASCAEFFRLDQDGNDLDPE